ncbi:MAG: ribosome recycling factor [Clostridia bacterium]|nr:ribosome recycling factor [Clostridia bacterium]
MAYGIDEVDMIFDDFTDRCSKTISSFNIEMKAIRAGRANPHILDKVVVNYYGTETPLQQMANVSIAEARLLVISVWDKGALKDVEKAIYAANIGLTPNNDGTVIRLIFPEITEERRKQLVKEIRTAGEASKVAVRNGRRDAIDMLKKLEKDSSITEDDLKDFTKDIDKQLSDASDELDKLIKDKENEVMSV